MTTRSWVLFLIVPPEAALAQQGLLATGISKGASSSRCNSDIKGIDAPSSVCSCFRSYGLCFGSQVYAKLLGWVSLDRFVLNWKEKTAQANNLRLRPVGCHVLSFREEADLGGGPDDLRSLRRQPRHVPLHGFPRPQGLRRSEVLWTTDVRRLGLTILMSGEEGCSHDDLQHLRGRSACAYFESQVCHSLTGHVQNCVTLSFKMEIESPVHGVQCRVRACWQCVCKNAFFKDVSWNWQSEGP